VDQPLFAVIMEAYLHGTSTRKVDDHARFVYLGPAACEFFADWDRAAACPSGRRRIESTASLPAMSLSHTRGSAGEARTTLRDSWTGLPGSHRYWK